MDVLVLVPFKKEHMARIREAAGPGVNVIQRAEWWRGRANPEGTGLPPSRMPDGTLRVDPLHDIILQADVIIGEPHPRLLSFPKDKAKPPLKWIQMVWAGADMYTKGRIPFPEGVALTNVAGAAYGHIISQYVVGQVLALAQNLPAYTLQKQSKSWNDLGPVFSLEGARVLVFGAGDIGRHVAKRLSGFDVERIVGVCRDVSVARDGFDELVTLPRAESLLPSSDVVIGCIPSSSETTGYLGARRLRLMKEGSILVNVGRGDFVDGNALDTVLTEGRLRGAALDVCEREPLPLDHPLWRNARCVITPHVSGTAFGRCDGTEERICQVCCDNLRRFVAGEPLLHRIF